MNNSSSTIRVYTGQDTKFKKSHLPLARIGHSGLTEWAETRWPNGKFATDQALWFLIHIQITVTAGQERHFWVLVTGDTWHPKGELPQDNKIQTAAFNMSSMAASARTVNTHDTRVKQQDVFSEFEKGRIYQAADEAAIRGQAGLRRLESLVNELSKPQVQAMRIGYHPDVFDDDF